MWGLSWFIGVGSKCNLKREAAGDLTQTKEKKAM